nr:maturase [Enterococcus sp. BWB1-3]
MYTEKLMTQILDQGNLKQAIKQVKRNKGAAGVGGMETDELDSYLAGNLEEIRRQILARKYQPQPVLQVVIPKPNGGERLLGIPTVTD